MSSVEHKSQYEYLTVTQSLSILCRRVNLPSVLCLLTVRVLRRWASPITTYVNKTIPELSNNSKIHLHEKLKLPQSCTNFVKVFAILYWYVTYTILHKNIMLAVRDSIKASLLALPSERTAPLNHSCVRILDPSCFYITMNMAIKSWGGLLGYPQYY